MQAVSRCELALVITVSSPPQRLSGFGVTVLAARRSERIVEEGVVDAGDWRTRLGNADFVVLTLPSTAATRSIVGAAELAAMKPGAWLVNVARGSLVDEPALLAALNSGHLGGAILDAFATEPLPAEHSFWGLDNVILISAQLLGLLMCRVSAQACRAARVRSRSASGGHFWQLR